MKQPRLTLLIVVLTGISALAGVNAAPIVEFFEVDLVDPDTGGVIRTDDLMGQLTPTPGDAPDSVRYSGKIETPEYTLNYEFEIDPDPLIIYAVSLFNTSPFLVQSKTRTFTGVFAVPIGADNVVTASIVGSVIDFFGDGVTVNPFGQSHIAVSTISSAANPSVNMGVNVGDAFTAAPAGSFTIHPYVLVNANNNNLDPAPDALWDSFGATISFDVTPLDQATFTGVTEIQAVSDTVIPEPSTVLLFAVGLLCLIGIGYRHRQKAA